MRKAALTFKQLPSSIRWHFIGSLQSNKCKTLAGPSRLHPHALADSVVAIPNLYALETLDSEKKADLLEKALASSDRSLRVYLQLNTSGEDNKAGVADVAALRSLAQHIRTSCPHLEIVGLMTIGSYEASQDNDASNPDFEALSRAREELGEPSLELSMGMSADFAKAITMGSDNVRVGSRAFGARPSKEEAKALRETESASH